MRVLQVVNSLAAGGAEIFATSLALELSRQGHQVSVFAYAGAVGPRGAALREALGAAGIPFAASRHRSRLNRLLVPLEIRREIERFAPDIVHSHLEQSDLFAAMAARLFRARRFIHVRTVHSSRPDVLPAFAHSLLNRLADCSVACGDSAAESGRATPAQKIVIENGVDIAAIDQATPDPAIRSTLGVGESTSLLVNVGALALRNGMLGKAQDLIVRALGALHDRDISAIFVGDGPERARIEALATTLGVRGKCHFVGSVSNPADYTVLADVVVMPSRFEGLSVAAMEAACAGRPLILSDISAFRAFDGSSTTFVQAESVADLAAAIERVVADKSRFAADAARERSRYRARFAIGTAAGRYLELYAKLSGVGRGH